MSSEDNLEDVEEGSQLESDVTKHYTSSFLDAKFESSWKVAKIQKIKNDKLAQEYEDKRQELLVRGRKDDELQEKFGFFVDNNMADVELVASLGQQVRESEYNALGYNRQGVYLCKHADVCLQHSLVKHSGSQVMRMIMCQYVSGRPTTAIPRVASASEFIEPTQGFDCHESVISPDARDSLQNKFDRSQVYLYEITKLLQPSQRPRQVLPYAVLTFTLQGTYLPAIDAEPTPEQRLTSAARLQQAATQQINNNVIGESGDVTCAARPLSSNVIGESGDVTSATQFQQMDNSCIEASGSATPLVAAPAAAGAGSALVGVSPGAAVTLPTTTSPTVASPSSNGPMIGPALANGSAAEQSSPGGASSARNGPSVSPATNSEPEPGNLNKVVTQLNAKLGNEPTHRPGRESIHMTHPRASPAVSSLPAPPAPPAQLTHMQAAQHQQGLMVNPAIAAQLHGQPVSSLQAIQHQQQMLAAQQGLLPSPHQLLAAQQQAAALMPGQPGLMPTPGQHPLLQAQHAALLQGQAGLLQAQPGLLQAQPGLLPGQPGLLPGQHALLQGQPGVMPGAGHIMLPNGMVLARPGLQQVMQVPGAAGAAFPGMLQHPGLRPQLLAMAQGRAQGAEPTHVPTAGYVANNVSGYTPANSTQTGAQQLGQPIPVLANGAVVSTSSSQQASQPMYHVAGVPGFPGVSMSAAMPGLATMSAQAMPGMQGMAGGIAGMGVQQSMAGLMMAPSPAGLPAHHQLQALQRPLFQKLPAGAAMQHGFIPAGATALPVQRTALTQTLKRPLTDPVTAAVIDKRLRLA